MSGILDILESAEIRIKAEAKLHHMSDVEREKFVMGFFGCGDPVCSWCRDLSENIGEKK